MERIVYRWCERRIKNNNNDTFVSNAWLVLPHLLAPKSTSVDLTVAFWVSVGFCAIFFSIFFFFVFLIFWKAIRTVCHSICVPLRTYDSHAHTQLYRPWKWNRLKHGKQRQDILYTADERVYWFSSCCFFFFLYFIICCCLCLWLRIRQKVVNAYMQRTLMKCDTASEWRTKKKESFPICNASAFFNAYRNVCSMIFMDFFFRISNIFFLIFHFFFSFFRYSKFAFTKLNFFLLKKIWLFFVVVVVFIIMTWHGLNQIIQIDWVT